MEIFRQYKRSDFHPQGNLESAFGFLDRSAWTISELVRGCFKNWLEAFPSDADFINKLTSSDDQQHHAAVFELILYNSIRKGGFSVEVHPDLPSRSKPDFRIADNDGFCCYAECTLAGNSYESLEEKRRKASVLEIINGLVEFPYYVGIDFMKISKSSVSKNNLLRFLNSLAQMSANLSDEQLMMNKPIFSDNGWELEIILFRKTVPGRRRNVGFQQNEARFIDPKKTLLGALNDKKPSKYGLSDEIFLIAVNETDAFSNDLTSAELLFGAWGEEQIHLRNSHTKGLFYFNGRPLNTSVAALIRCKHVSHYMLANSQIKILHNPFAKTPLPLGKLPFNEEYYILENETLYKREVEKDLSLLSLLGIDELEFTAAYQNKSNEVTK